MYLLSSDELKTYDHSVCDIKVKIVIDFSYLNDMDLIVFFKSNIENFKGWKDELKKKVWIKISVF